MKILIGGAMGHMGRELAGIAAEAGITVACGIDVAWRGQATEYPMVSEYRDIHADADVLIDFSRADSLPNLLEYAVKARMPGIEPSVG